MRPMASIISSAVSGAKGENSMRGALMALQVAREASLPSLRMRA